MANNLPNKVKVPVARPRSSEMDLSYDVYTTSDFFKNSIICAKEIVPGDKFDTIKVESFARLAPLAVPTFGQMKLKTHSFFVPYRVLMQSFNDFISQTPYNNTTKINYVPRVQMANLVQLFTVSSYDYATTQTSEDYDVQAIFMQGSDPTYIKLKFTDKGRRAYDILLGLGYNISLDRRDTKNVSMLPLLAYAKIFYDWFYPAQYLLNSKLPTFFDTMNKSFSTNDVKTILDEILYLTYEKDFYNQIWENPVGPNTNQSSPLYNISITDPTTANIRIDQDDKGTPIIVGTATAGAPVTSISQFAIRGLNALTSFMERNRLAGYRPMERFLARYGLKLDDSKLQRSVFLGSQEQYIQVSDVTSTADTITSSGSALGATLGAQAGKGIVYSGGEQMHLNSDEFGILIITSSIIPHVAYADGLNRDMFHLTPLDFYTPEFDNLGVQAITRRELSALSETVEGNPSNLDKVYGFVPRYSEYKHSADLITGQFRSHRIFDNTTLNAYMFKYQFDSAEMTELEAYMNQDNLYGDQQFDNIFNYSQTDVDHFHLVHHVTLHAYRPMASLAETLPIPGTGDVSMSYNGITMN